MDYFVTETKGENPSETTDGSHNLIVEAMKTLSKLDTDDEIITEYEMKITHRKRNEGEKEEFDVYENGKHKILVNKNTIECMEMLCKSSRALTDLFRLLEDVSRLQIVFQEEQYHEFRSLFTSRYIEAFGNSTNVSWCYNTDEINKLLSVRNIGYRIIRVTNPNNSGNMHTVIVSNQDKLDTHVIIDDNLVPESILNAISSMDNAIFKLNHIMKKSFREFPEKFTNDGFWQIVSEFRKIYNDGFNTSYTEDDFEINKILRQLKIPYRILFFDADNVDDVRFQIIEYKWGENNENKDIQ